MPFNYSDNTGGADCAIYCIFNANKKKYYIGQSRNIFSRRNKHAHELKHGKHFSLAMQNDYNAGDNLIFKALEFFPGGIPQEYLDAKERAYILKYKALAQGYNKSLPSSNISAKAKPDKYEIDEAEAAQFIKRLCGLTVTYRQLIIIDRAIAWKCQMPLNIKKIIKPKYTPDKTE